MKFKHIEVYIGALVFGFIIAAVFLPKTEEGYQTGTGIGIPPAPTVKCLTAGTQCRFVSTADTTPQSIAIAEQSLTVPTCSYGTVIGTLDGTTGLCSYPSESTPPSPQPSCAFGESYNQALQKCYKLVGTVSKCLPDVPSATDPAVQTLMACYANRHPEIKKVYGNDTQLLLNHFLNEGMYRAENPCCDAAAPTGTVTVGKYTIEKDWRFWTIVGLGSSTIVMFLILSFKG